MKETILKCFQLALEANGERLGGHFEQELLAEYVLAFPDHQRDILDLVVERLIEIDNDIGESRLLRTYKDITGEEVPPSWEKQQ